MVRAKLKLVNKGRAPEREALAKAIAALAEVDRDLHEHHEAAARKAVDEAAWAVIRASGWPEWLFAEARAAQEEAFRTRAALRFFADSDAVFPKDPPGQFGEVSSFLWSRAELPTCRGDIEYADWRAHPGALLWMETLEALRRDPDAALPE